jgi:hypothetical protein
MYVDQFKEELGIRLIFWISIGIFGGTIISAGVLLIAFSNIKVTWSYGAGFISSVLGAVFIVLSTFLYKQTKQDL